MFQSAKLVLVNKIDLVWFVMNENLVLDSINEYWMNVLFD